MTLAAAVDNIDWARPPSRLAQIYPEPRPDLGVVHGDCVRTVLAMLLGASSPAAVPHFETWDERDAWLRERGGQLVWVPLPCPTAECVLDRLPTYLNGYPAMLSGRTAQGYGHVVAVIDNLIVDTVPWTTGNPLMQPDCDGFFWLMLLVPLRSNLSAEIAT